MNDVTIYDVAQKAEVGIGTVSRVLNNSENVKDKTREKVLKAITKLNYRPSAMARGLALQKTDSIAVVVPYFTHHFFVEILKGVQEELKEFDMDLVLFNVADKDEKDKYINRLLKERKVDGVLAITLNMTKEEVTKFKEKNIPLVLVDDNQQGISSIFVDDIKGTKKAINYLVDSGHERICFLNGSLDSKQGARRLKGVKKALNEAGLELNSDLFKVGDFTENSGYKLMEEILKLEEVKRPTAIFAASDNQAIGALNAIEDAGLSVPDDFSLVGYDDIELAHYLGLTTVRQPMFKMGKLGVEILVQSIYSKEEKSVKKKLEPELVCRESG